MAKEKYNIQKKIKTFSQVLFCVSFFRFLFFSYSFLSFLFWLLNCFEVDWLYLFNWLFVIPYQIVAIFYQPMGVSADFSLVIIGVVMLLGGFLFNYLFDYMEEKIYDLKEEEQKMIEARREKRKQANSRRNLRTSLGEIIENPLNDSKLLFIIQPHINKIKRKADDLELTFQEVELWKQRVNKKLIENINYSKPMQKGYYRKNLFVMYKDFSYADDFIYYIRPTLDSIVLEFRKYGILVSFCYVLSAISTVEMLEKELDCMDTVLSLNFMNDFIVTNRFKVTYDIKPIHQYQMKLKGEYNLSKNLTISNKQPLFILIDKNIKSEVKKENKNENEDENNKNGT